MEGSEYEFLEIASLRSPRQKLVRTAMTLFVMY